jgi:hypothetical protein
MRRHLYALCLALSLLAVLVVPAAAQGTFVDPTTPTALYIPRNVRNAYENGTRSMDGNPGENYWQNRSSHTISITVAPPNRTVTATQEFTYYNESPDTLDHVMIRVYQNIHRPEAVREPAELLTAEFINDGAVITNFKINGEEAEWPTQGELANITLFKVVLPTPLESGGSVTFSMDWHFDLTAANGWKQGFVDDTTYFLAYFFPRVAVYDDIDGWDTNTYTAGREMYNDFADFTFDVTVPKNFIVWATGDLLNAAEVLQPDYAARLEQSFTSDENINIARPEEIQAGSVTAQTDTVTWRWMAQNVPDIAIGLSDHFAWDAASVVVDAATGRRASAQAAYQAENFAQIIDSVKFGLTFGSTEYPGVPYPYSKMTLFEGGADEEYPMMANDAAGGPFAQVSGFVAAHEILHTWFPFYTGINESRYPFMDEGVTTAFEYHATTGLYGADTAKYLFTLIRSGEGQPDIVWYDVPIITPFDQIRQYYGSNYIAYGKPALAFLALEDMIGKENYVALFQEFINRWNGKHPMPWDMFNTFNAVSDEDLTWFFYQWFFTPSFLDLAITDVQPADGGYDLEVANVGGAPMPFDVVVTHADGSVETIHQTSAIWKDTQTATIRIETVGDVQSIAIDTGLFIDADAPNNTWASS